MENYFFCCFRQEPKEPKNIDFQDFFDIGVETHSNTPTTTKALSKAYTKRHFQETDSKTNNSNKELVPVQEKRDSKSKIKDTIEKQEKDKDLSDSAFSQSKRNNNTINNSHSNNPKKFNESNQVSHFTDIDVQENPKLELLEYEGKILNGLRIEILASGMSKYSERNAKDGVSFFGFKTFESNQVSHNLPLDYVLNIESDNTTTNVLFKIFFDKPSKKYYISSNIGEGDKTIVFVKIENPFVIKNKHIISLGEIHISVEVDLKGSLQIDVVTGNENPISKTFHMNHTGPVRIGRSKDCEFMINNLTISKVQTSFKYIGENWIIYDGTENKKSTNGTWIYLDDDWPINEDILQFRIDKNFLHLRKM